MNWKACAVIERLVMPIPQTSLLTSQSVRRTVGGAVLRLLWCRIQETVEVVGVEYDEAVRALQRLTHGLLRLMTIVGLDRDLSRVKRPASSITG